MYVSGNTRWKVPTAIRFKKITNALTGSMTFQELSRGFVLSGESFGLLVLDSPRSAKLVWEVIHSNIHARVNPVQEPTLYYCNETFFCVPQSSKIHPWDHHSIIDRSNHDQLSWRPGKIHSQHAYQLRSERVRLCWSVFVNRRDHAQ
uniref:Uncharacterized protein n=1 Tax=Trichuris muris TaxID=70415 RepID=A0A5S6QQI1_TRIMR